MSAGRCAQYVSTKEKRKKEITARAHVSAYKQSTCSRGLKCDKRNRLLLQMIWDGATQRSGAKSQTNKCSPKHNSKPCENPKGKERVQREATFQKTKRGYMVGGSRHQCVESSVAPCRGAEGTADIMFTRQANVASKGAETTLGVV